MIKNIIFDFGDIFLNLDKPATLSAFKKFGLQKVTEEMQAIMLEYEKGGISTVEFLLQLEYYFPNQNKSNLITAWNAILLDFPTTRLEFLKQLQKSNKYRLFLLSNTNELHIQYVQETMGDLLWKDFNNCFEHFYLSHEIGMRKPDKEIFEFVLQENNLNPYDTLFIDDTKENCNTASALGIHIWHLQVGNEEVHDLIHRLV